MGLICDCDATELPDIPIDNCPESMGQIQKVIFQRVFSAAGVKNKFIVATANPNVLASWTPLLASSISTKVVQSPYISSPESEPGAPRTFGGGNETLNGIELIIGSDPTTFTGNILRSKQNTIQAMKLIMCEEVGVFLVDEHGNIGAIGDADTPVNVFPIPIDGFFVGDKSFGNYEGVDMNGIQWKFRPNWSDEFTIVVPTDFNALTDLVTP